MNGASGPVRLAKMAGPELFTLQGWGFPLLRRKFFPLSSLNHQTSAGYECYFLNTKTQS